MSPLSLMRSPDREASPQSPPVPARRVTVRLDPDRIWRWQLWLLDALARAGIGQVAVAFGPGHPLPPALRLLLSLERQIYRLRGEQAADLVDPGDLRAFGPKVASGPEGGPDLVIDLTGDPCAAGGPCLQPLYGGLAGDDALLDALLAGEPVRLRLAGSPHRADADLLPAAECRTVLTRSLNRVFSTVLSLCLAEALGPLAAPERRAGVAVRARSARPGAAALGAFLARTAAAKLAARLTRLCTTAPHWRVGWRPLSGEADFTGRTGQVPGGYAVLPDDGRRYYADPFVLAEAGRRFLFVEEYGYAGGKGLISAAEIGPDGRIGTPRPVIEEAHHLSYPFVFAHAGAHYMIPESSSCRRVELYRATRLPDRWERVAILLDGIAASDVTLTRMRGTWWMFAGTHPWQSSVRDTLSLFSAPDLLGPWTPHPQNPVVVDLRAARPGGALYRKGGHLWRPAQDATGGYGSALSLCRIDRLTPTEYRQSLETVLRPGGPWATAGLHTLNRGGGIEVIDGLF
ncbi:glucosamine inositolphosphorylceramide transferase family protein [Methylobacterium oryzihabitans]|uniref:Formyl transferase n=1 Tax=Methylobacterium oryzihabitans TaxID=2499852 RepID=A0A3S2VDN1_9HYPH|nr:formyl transferase [Methylobacterium oryzihabitans]RVU20581.1 formyl transferase [Methylobacterium oryzihabitans]